MMWRNMAIILLSCICSCTGCKASPSEDNRTTKDVSTVDTNKSRGKSYREIIDDLQRDYKKRTLGLRDDTKDDWAKKEEAVSDLLEHLSPGDSIILHRGFLEENPRTIGHFKADLLHAQLLLDIRAGKREESVMAISRFAPQHSSLWLPIECTFAWSPIEDGITVLHDSYWICKDIRNRQVILDLLSTGFPDLRKMYLDNDAFVRESRYWYWANKWDLKVNDDYVLAAMMDEDAATPTPLFVRKTAPFH
jgi:hypothetical protein